MSETDVHISRVITNEELAEHNTKESLWLLIDDSVYDVTLFLEEHPGGEHVLLEQAGKDATEAFNDAGHSSDAKGLMQDFKIGKIFEPGSCRCFWLQYVIPVVLALTSSFIFFKYYKQHM